MADIQPPPNTAAANVAASVPSKEHLRTRCCYCLCKTLWILLVLVIVLVMLVILVFYIIITPRSFRFHVTDTTLTQFDYAANSTLRYNLVLNITASNPNKKLKIYYDVVQANAFYGGVRFSTTDINMPWNSYLQDKKGTNLFSAVFSGQHVMVFDRNQVSDFHEDTNDGVFPIDVMIRFTIRFRLEAFQFGYYYPRGMCELKVPLTSKGEKVVPFKVTKCRIDF
ncbi:NDR1/HIN1-like protein 3 [Vigna umbellata]|uniref:NDR1/HIN1-like protein 3 n=1 Tax=Vigna umbellata TaxID=87088 RepID=UPI001F5FEC2E|nr:NDR1/HIN1-like protein 3 [Vigna umbellata]